MDTSDLSRTSMNNVGHFEHLMDETPIFEMMQKIHAISEIVNQGHSFEETLSAILDKVVALVGMEDGGIYQKDNISGDYVLRVHNFSDKLNMQSIQQKWDPLLSVMDGKVIAIPDMRADLSDMEKDNSGCRSFIGIPLIKQDEKYGILIASSPHFREFSEFEKRIFSIIGMHIAGYISQNNLMQELIKSKEMYYDLFHNAKDMIYTHDLDGNLLTMNQAGSDILGHPIDEILSMNMNDFLTEDSIEIESEIIQQLMFNENVLVQPIFEVVDKNGEKLFMEFSLRAIMENGRPVAVHGIGRNVNKRLQAEKNMLVLSKAINMAADGFDISDAEHKISYINDAGARLFGYSRRELLGQPATIFYAEEDFPNLHENVIPAMEQYGYWSGLILGRKKDGSVIPVEVTLSSVNDEHGKPLVNLGVFRTNKSND